MASIASCPWHLLLCSWSDCQVVLEVAVPATHTCSVTVPSPQIQRKAMHRSHEPLTELTSRLGT